MNKVTVIGNVGLTLTLWSVSFRSVSCMGTFRGPILNYTCIFLSLFIYFERERENMCEQGRGREAGRERERETETETETERDTERERERENPKQALC